MIKLCQTPEKKPRLCSALRELFFSLTLFNKKKKKEKKYYIWLLKSQFNSTALGRTEKLHGCCYFHTTLHV